MIRLAGPRGVAVAVLAFLAFAGAALAAPKFPPLTGRVVDNANLLSPQAEQRLTDDLAALEQKTGHQVVVVTTPDLQGYPIEDYGYQLGRAWGVGDKVRNDGVVFLVAPNDRKVRIEVGYGLEPVLTDALSSTIIQAKVLPAFRAGKLEQGVVDGAEAVIQQLSLPEDQARAIAAQPVADQSSGPQVQGSHIPVFLILLIAFWIISSVLRGLGGRGRGLGGLWWLPFLFMNGGGRRGGWSGGGGGWSGGGGGGGGFSGGGGSFGGGGSSGDW
ncbi:MAG TPA: TPM domain-containing protein [Phenylobacterium sp.]|nr:TPM domain-containing protein [Phenylobacterium sp.]